MKPWRLFILRYLSSPYDNGQPFFLALEEHLPGGTVNEFEADDPAAAYSVMGSVVCGEGKINLGGRE